MNTSWQFITLAVTSFGFVPRGLGAGVRDCVYRGKPLAPFLETFGQKFPQLQKEVGEAWDAIDKQNPGCKANEKPVREMLYTAAWAYALCVDLQQFRAACIKGPTDPLNHSWLRRLEEIYTKCFAAAHMYGPEEESMVGLQGILTDFVGNGGVNPTTGNKGAGFHTTMTTNFIAYMHIPERAAIMYQKFGEYMEALVHLVEKDYPLILPSLTAYLEEVTTSENFGFGSTKVVLPAKTDLMEKLGSMRHQLLIDRTAKAA